MSGGQAAAGAAAGGPTRARPACACHLSWMAPLFSLAPAAPCPQLALQSLACLLPPASSMGRCTLPSPPPPTRPAGAWFPAGTGATSCRAPPSANPATAMLPHQLQQPLPLALRSCTPPSPPTPPLRCPSPGAATPPRTPHPEHPHTNWPAHAARRLHPSVSTAVNTCSPLPHPTSLPTRVCLVPAFGAPARRCRERQPQCTARRRLWPRNPERSPAAGAVPCCVFPSLDVCNVLSLRRARVTGQQRARAGVAVGGRRAAAVAQAAACSGRHGAPWQPSAACPSQPFKLARRQACTAARHPSLWIDCLPVAAMFRVVPSHLCLDLCLPGAQGRSCRARVSAKVQARRASEADCALMSC